MPAKSSQIPVVALVGRTNTGKSRLFNALCGRPEALVSNSEHLTRDWRETVVTLGGREVLLRDTAGMASAGEGLAAEVAARTREQIKIADALLFLVDASVGLQPNDSECARELRRSGKPMALVINKMDTSAGRRLWTEFAELGIPLTVAISAERHEGLAEIGDALDEALEGWSPSAQGDDIERGEARDGALEADAEGKKECRDEEDDAVVDDREGKSVPAGNGPEGADAYAKEGRGELILAVCGLSNSGKSTLINRLTRSDRLIVDSGLGTTREPIGQELAMAGQSYRIYDTSGFRRRADTLQYLADSKTERLLDGADQALYLIDATRGATRADLRRLGQLLEAGLDPLIVCNKVDLLEGKRRRELEDELMRRLDALGMAGKPVWVSAARGAGLRSLSRRLRAHWREAQAHFATNRLTRILNQATLRRPPPSIDSRRIRLRMAHQGGSHPLLIVVHGKQTTQLGDTYKRYLAKAFGERLGLRHTIPRLAFSTDDNPYAKPMRG